MWSSSRKMPRELKHLTAQCSWNLSAPFQGTALTCTSSCIHINDFQTTQKETNKRNAERKQCQKNKQTLAFFWEPISSKLILRSQNLSSPLIGSEDLIFTSALVPRCQRDCLRNKLIQGCAKGVFQVSRTCNVVL